MPLRALRTVSKSRNGVSSYILACKRLDFHYCDWAGSSRGMKAFLQTRLAAFAQRNPSIEITVSPRPSTHPIIRGTYINGREKVVCVRNLTRDQIAQKALLLRDASGEKNRRRTARPGAGGVIRSGGQESVRGVWSPFHESRPERRWKI